MRGAQIGDDHETTRRFRFIQVTNSFPKKWIIHFSMRENALSQSSHNIDSSPTVRNFVSITATTNSQYGSYLTCSAKRKQLCLLQGYLNFGKAASLLSPRRLVVSHTMHCMRQHRRAV